MDPAILIPIFAAFLGGGAVALYLARSQRDSIIVGASDKAVDVVTKALDRQEEDNEKLRERVRLLEVALGEAVEVSQECRRRVEALTRRVEELGGKVDDLSGDD